MSTIASLPSLHSVSVPAATAQRNSKAFLKSRNDPDWVVERRREAFDVYEQKLAEPLSPEEYKRVDLRAFQPSRFAIGPAPSAPAQFETLLEKKAEFAGAVSHLDGHCVAARLDEKLASRGVLFRLVGRNFGGRNAKFSNRI